jgi:uncharacterized protein YbjT (DUF2867 family)
MSEKQIVTIMTGSSNSGSACIHEIYSRYSDKLTVRAAFRTAEKAKPLQDKYPDLQVFIGIDANKPETMKEAFTGADSALIVTPHDPKIDLTKNNDAELTANMINVAVECGVKYLVYVGSFTVNCADAIKIIGARFVPSEKLLRELGESYKANWTSLRGGFFMENLPWMLKRSLKNESAVRFADYPIVPIDTRDIGKSAAACLANPENHYGKCYEMNGPETYTGEKLAELFTKILGRPITWIKITDEDAKHMPLPMYEIYQHFSAHGINATLYTDDVKKLTGQWGTLEQFVQDHLSDFD